MIEHGDRNRRNAGMTEGLPPALFLADALGLDFLNSVAAPSDRQIEWLGTGKNLLEWLRQANLVPDAAAASISSRIAPGEVDAAAVRARALREWFRGFVLTHKGHKLAPGVLTELRPLIRVIERDEAYGVIAEKAANGRRGVNRRETGEGQSAFEFQWHRRWRTADSLLLPIAVAMADLICFKDFSRVKKCEAPNCTLLFLDTTKGHTRRWCSMSICGNRAKQAAYRDRTKKAKR